MNKLNLKFGTPEHGWMEVQISSPENEIAFNVSDVPCDSVYGLIKALSKLLEGSIEEVVEWSLEPEYAEWIFKRKDNDIELSVSCPAGSPPVLSFQYDSLKLIRRVYKSLRDLETNPVWDEVDVSENIWSWNFPSNNLKILKEKLKNAEQNL